MAETNELSEREIEILRLVATGASNKEIAQNLYISANTVKVHLRNIFTKIGVASRTEAAMYAVQQGLVRSPGEEDQLANSLAGESQVEVAGGVPRWMVAGSWLALGLILLAVILGGLPKIIGPEATLTAQMPIQPTETPRWQEREPMANARANMAIAAYNNLVFAIGGDTSEGVTGNVERYTADTNTWDTVAEKPTPVAEAMAAVVGGKIIVPGGRTPSGAPTAIVEIYDPIRNNWNRGSDLPAPICAYAMVAYEGRLYMFGGWDGEKVVGSVLRYDPLADTWEQLTGMPTPRAYAGAAVADQQIFVVGGWQGETALATNEIYSPPREAAGENPWRNAQSLPEGRYAMGVTSVVDIVYVIGGESSNTVLTPALEYLPNQDSWQVFDQPATQPWSRMGLVMLGPQLYLVGGEIEGQPSAQNLAYQAIYTIAIPSIVK